MGILRTREEYLPVTCAILKPEDREAFFSAVKKHAHGRPEQLAKLCEVETEQVNDWISGKANVPYHTLQMLAHHFEVPQPPVGELRREYQAVSQTAARREPAAAAKKAREGRPAKARGEKPKAEPRRRREKAPKPERAARQKRPEAEKAPARDEAPPRHRTPARAPKERKAPPPKGPRVPGPSEALAYWVGVAIMTARRQGAELVMTADRRVGQNFAGSWAGLTRELFGVKPSLAMIDDGKAQEARLPAAGFEEFLDRLDLKEGRRRGEAPVPRWAWSNPAWKTACLKGVVDACAYFQRAPALTLPALPERLARAVEKMLGALKLEASAAPDGTISLKGEAVDRYFEAVGTSNMKLRDQYKACRGGRGAAPSEARPHGRGRPEAGALEEMRRTPRRRLEENAPENPEADEERVLGEELEAADEEAAQQAAEEAVEALGDGPSRADPLESAIDAAAAAKAFASDQPSRFAPPPPQPPQSHPPRRRRTLFRGRPKR